MPEQGLLIVLSGPSGAGKGTLCHALLNIQPNMYYSISITTRLPRPGEKEGINYYFTSRECFQQMLSENAFLEWAEVYGNYYGTPRKPVEEKLNQGKDVILEIDIQGALQVKSGFSQGVYIFIVPPSLQELEKRIVKRDSDSPEAIRRRLNSVSQELNYISEYDYVVVNDEVDAAVAKIIAIIQAEKCRPQRKPFILI
ncbi:MAG: guanylate kinase [Bacillota bacterium]